MRMFYKFIHRLQPLIGITLLVYAGIILSPLSKWAGIFCYFTAIAATVLLYKFYKKETPVGGTVTRWDYMIWTGQLICGAVLLCVTDCSPFFILTTFWVLVEILRKNIQVRLAGS